MGSQIIMLWHSCCLSIKRPFFLPSILPSFGVVTCYLFYRKIHHKKPTQIHILCSQVRLSLIIEICSSKTPKISINIRIFQNATLFEQVKLLLLKLMSIIICLSTADYLISHYQYTKHLQHYLLMTILILGRLAQKKYVT